MTATADRTADRTAETVPGLPDTTGLGYEEKLRILSEASVHQHFDAFLDIAWDDPDFEVRNDDPRWVLPEVDSLGGTDWYRSLPLERQIAIGQYRMANIMKVGLQFEQLLIAGVMNHLIGMPNGKAEFRYSTHEVTEECHHTQMFQEGVNRIGLDVQGGPGWFVKVAPLLSLAGRALPNVFFMGILAGEEPIDHLQKSVLRSGHEMHPMVTRVMQIHVAEEARHIGFAHTYLEERSKDYGPVQRFGLSLAYPVIMRVLCDVIMKPTRKMQKDLDIPKDVMREVYWRSEKSQKLLRDTFGDVRMLADELGLMNPVSRRVWRLLGIAGTASRFRSEPKSAAV
ncbi:para-aminobenzoate N-oxygenase AurF [Nocardioides sp. J9]|uniref:AurF N-oxygenase family protein n=1 Tax=Nocardioides sp. J9 TaxID=935844 RepID=UPI0011A568B7|nr:diiron oxygenase [Nocardioides sp. J9]TWH00834.1 para-aminobenzoate N-oxygenase AurF [Nocardioides sp. J9]